MTTTTQVATGRKIVPKCDLRSLRVHRYAGLFPLLEGDERERLRASMKSGYDETFPIVCWSETGEILDGRNRRDLALELKLDSQGAPAAEDVQEAAPEVRDRVGEPERAWRTANEAEHDPAEALPA
jgi:hypothetical protein